MHAIEEEIRNLLRAKVNISHIAESGTTSTNIKVTNHGLRTGDNIKNNTRGGVVLAVTVIDANNFSVAAITGQSAGDNITFLKFKHYYVGELSGMLPVNMLPLVTVYGTRSSLVQRAQQGDKYSFDLVIEAYTNLFAKVSTEDLTDDILQAQLDLRKIMEERDNRNVPIASSVLGAISQNITGISFLFTENYVIEYSRDFYKNALYFKAKMTLKATSSFNPRT